MLFHPFKIFQQFSISFLAPLFMSTDFFHRISSLFASILLLNYEKRRNTELTKVYVQ